MKNYKKTEHFEPIAMKCTEGQFNELKPILDKFELYPQNIDSDWLDWCYLKNNGVSEKYFISNIRKEWKRDLNRKVYETFNAETFLKACGIVEVEKTYQLSETFVKELIKEPNIKETFIREGIIDETIEIKKSVILNTPNDLELVKLIRKMV